MVITHPTPRQILRLALSATTLAVLAACGGGGGGGGDADDDTGAGGALTLSGRVAASAALAGRPVQAKCGTLVGNATSDAEGQYTMAIDQGLLPCVLRVTTAGGETLHSVAVGSGSTATANINPVTEMVVASATAQAPATVFESFDTAAAGALTPATVQAATTTVTTTLASAGVDLSPAGNPLTTTSSSLTTALQTLDTTLAASGTPLATLVTSLAQTSPQATTPPPASASPLPAAQLLQPAAANCSALRSGTYRFIGFAPAEAGQAARTDTFTLDATALTLTFPGEAPEQITANGTCRYNVAATAGAEAVVSSAGVMAIRWFDETAGQFRLGLAFPEQSTTVADMAGEWNAVSLDNGVGPGIYAVDAYGFTVGSNGVLTAVAECGALTSCTDTAAADVPPIAFAVNPAGGLTWTNTRDNWTDQHYVYKAGNGGKVGVTIAGNGTMIIWTQKRANNLPVVGTVSETWNVGVSNTLGSTGPVSLSSNTIVSVDEAGGSYLRNSIANFTTGVTRPETLRFNSPRDGLTYRVPGTVTQSDGSSANVGEFLAMSLRGMGMSAVLIKGNNSLLFSVGTIAP